MTKANLFPDLAVSSLGNLASADVTFATETVCDAREMALRHLQQMARDEARPTIARVEGAYGAGKTHLLLATQRALLDEARRLHLATPIMLVAPTIQASPLGFFRESLGPEIERSPLEDLAVEVHGQAAQAVARLSVLTAPAIDRLRSEPSISRALVREELLNPTAVEGEFVQALKRICPDASDHVIHALSLLPWDQHAIAARWLAGRALSDGELAETRLPRVLAGEEECLAAIEAIAGLAQRSGRPFVLLIDEFEHFVRFDQARRSTRNITWLKRLLEHLAGRSAFVMVAGHTTAWTVERDLLDRFSPGHALQLAPLRAEQVQALADLFSGTPGAIDDRTAIEIRDASEGNMRRALAMLRRLFDLTDGFVRRASHDELRGIAEELRARINPEAAMERLEQSLMNGGFTIVHDAEIARGISADLLVEYEGIPAIVVERHRAAYQAKQHDQLQNFLERMGVLWESDIVCAGFFLSEGSLDQRVEALLQGEEIDLYAFDLTQPDFIERVQPTITMLAARSQSRSGDTRDAARAAQLIDSVQAIKQEDAPHYADLSTRAEARTGAVDLPYEVFSDVRDDARNIFEVLTNRPKMSPMRMLLGSLRGVLALIAGTVGIALIALAPTLASLFIGYESVDIAAWKGIFWTGGAACVFAAVLVVGYRLYMLESYYDFRERVLRDLLLRGADARTLVIASSTLDDVFEELGPGRLARAKALDRLRAAEGQLI